MAANNNGVDLTITNPDGNPVVFTNSPAITLTFSLSNQTNVNVTFGVGMSFDIFFPDCFVADDLKRMSVDLPGWDFEADTSDMMLVLTYKGSSQKGGNGNATWNIGQSFDIPVKGVQTKAQPTTDTAQVNLNGFPDSVSQQATCPMSVAKAPIKENGDLTKVLQVTLDNQGGVLVSPTGDPLQNTIFLNFKNIGNTPLYKGKTMWRGNPTVTVVMVYGTSTGSIAPDDKRNTGPGSGSAWNIVAGIPYTPVQNIWHAANPDKTSTAAHPSWVLTPTNLNPGIIGVGENANMTFTFSNIISFTPPGHTQMLVHFKGFMLDETTPYNDAIFVLDIAKQNAPPTRGLINFFSPQPIFQVSDPNTPITIPLRWAMFSVAKATLISSYPGMQPRTFPYTNPATIAYDNQSIVIPGITQSSVLSITLQAFNAMDGFLNSMQFTAFLQANMFVDPRDGRVYPAVQIGKRFWMAANLDYIPPSGGSSTYGPEAQYGRMYTWQAALPTQTLNGWRLPTKNDWTDLLKNEDYSTLITGGKTGFNALLNGSLNSDGSTNNDFGVYGYYWSAENNQGKVDYVSFSSNSKRASYITGNNNMPANNFISVKLVKDIG